MGWPNTYWLKAYAQQQDHLAEYDSLMSELRGKVRIGRKLTRDEMNER